ncbi:HAD hydrolase, family IA, variant 1 [Marvinbryantia formatexigens DSM 14469]|uniref:HAD hydrolase, family IA, variant 1 n=1 Tax=Marvinbryantia formatexigens DSM 14469 TaxID=478749 RepID=C6L911_9FIRM|nr:HAD family hydrolase [Marvinbryantia formatexigens]EET62750.1 HAD hydrolase, family IA, variant 1 [Marvinbryantia formatexigens DSM 14469]UWO23115.1 HAD family hydrolase [Marvinbryantia formatexigens DSM 14469]SDF99965.1 phosphoglycolate phosphatase [Marvinbryantia formatexigens]
MDGIIFDVDGTLWDSTDVVAVAYNRTISENTDLPIRVTPDDLKQLFGKPMDVIFATLLPSLPYERQCALAEMCFTQEHEELEKTPGTVYEGLEDALKALSAKYPLFIVSNCQSGYIELLFRKTGYGKYFKDHLCFGQTGTSKGQTILRLMRENNLQDPVYVGDTQGDADACKEAGIPFVFAEYGFGSVAEPDMRISCPMDLVSLF